MPYVATIKREDPLRIADTREIEPIVKRIAPVGATFSIAGWREESAYRLFYFETGPRRAPMRHLIDRSA